METRIETKVIISGLRLPGFHGVAPQERRVGNMFRFDIEISFPFVDGARADDLNSTLNYAEAIETVRMVNDQPSLLLENLAWRLRENLTARFPSLTGGRVRVTKLSPPISNTDVDGVGVEISW